MKRALASHEATLDLDDIASYIAADNVPAARRWLQGMEDFFDDLARSPLIGEKFHSDRHGDLRRISHGNYVVYYCPSPDGVLIVRVLHGARDHRRLI